MDNKFYQIEVTLKSKIDDTIDIFSYIFKKITQIKREVTFDKHGRTFINNKLFFPIGIFVNNINETLLEYINQTHLNFIVTYNEISKEDMDMVYTIQKGKIKVMYSIKDMFNFDYDLHIDLKEEENYKKVVKKINELKDHPALFAWYINDEYPPSVNKYFRNRTLTIHGLDPNHPTYTALCVLEDIRDFINTTDILSLDKYPIGISKIRDVFDYQNKTFYYLLETRPSWPIVQLFDWLRYDKINQSYPPSLDEIRSMTWQAFVAGGKGIMFYSLPTLTYMNKITPFKERWKDVIEITEQIWKYKDLILSIENVNKIEYKENPGVKFKQWKYNNSNYIVFVNLERNKETFEINLLNKCQINKEFGLGDFNQNGNNITINLQPIDVFMIKYFYISDKSDKSDNSYLGIIISIIVTITVIIILAFVFKVYLSRKRNRSSNIDDIDSNLLKDN